MSVMVERMIDERSPWKSVFMRSEGVLEAWDSDIHRGWLLACAHRLFIYSWIDAVRLNRPTSDFLLAVGSQPGRRGVAIDSTQLAVMQTTLREDDLLWGEHIRWARQYIQNLNVPRRPCCISHMRQSPSSLLQEFWMFDLEVESNHRPMMRED